MSGERISSPFCQSVERLIRRFGDDRHLVTPNAVDEAATLHDRFRANENEVHLVHRVRDSRVENDGARDTGRREQLMRSEPDGELHQ
jgi:hypothetical protein